jgi:hypothetical protein
MGSLVTTVTIGMTGMTDITARAETMTQTMTATMTDHETDVAVDLRRLVRLIETRAPYPSCAAPPEVTYPGTTLPGGIDDPTTAWLYREWYIAIDESASADTDAGAGAGSASNPAVRRDTLDALLRACVPASSVWETGWVATRVHRDGGCDAQRGQSIRTLRLGDFVNSARPGLPVVPGDALDVCARVDWIDTATAMWYLQSTHGPPLAPLVRLYFSVRPDSVAAVLRVLTVALASHAMRFVLKCPLHPSHYLRADALVLYVERSSAAAAETLARQAAFETAGRLRSSRPALTRALAPGVSMADDPGPDTSFGEHRCRLLAPAVRSLMETPAASIDEALARLQGALANAGVDPARPWLSPAVETPNKSNEPNESNESNQSNESNESKETP